MFIDFSRGAIKSFVLCQGLCYLASDKKLYKSQLELMGCLVVLLKHITVSTTLQARKTAVLLLGHRGRGRVSKHIQLWLEMGHDPVWWATDPFSRSWSSLRENLSLISCFSRLICHGRILTLYHHAHHQDSIYLGHLPKIELKLRNRSKYSCNFERWEKNCKFIM